MGPPVHTERFSTAAVPARRVFLPLGATWQVFWQAAAGVTATITVVDGDPGILINVADGPEVDLGDGRIAVSTSAAGVMTFRKSYEHG